MPLEKIVKDLLTRLDEKTTNVKNGIIHIARLINENFDEYSSAFSQDINRTFKNNLEYLQEEIEEKGYDIVKKNFIESRLYHETVNMINTMASEKTHHIGMTTYYEEVQTPDIILGLAEYHNTEYGILKKITKKGLKIINDYRNSMNLEPVE
jgi:hypothetical protein